MRSRSANESVSSATSSSISSESSNHLRRMPCTTSGGLSASQLRRGVSPRKSISGWSSAMTASKSFFASASAKLVPSVDVEGVLRAASPRRYGPASELDHVAHDLERTLDAGAVHVEVRDGAQAFEVKARDLHARAAQILAGLCGVLHLEHDDVGLDRARVDRHAVDLGE